VERGDLIIGSAIAFLIGAIALLAITNSPNSGNAAEWTGAIGTIIAILGTAVFTRWATLRPLKNVQAENRARAKMLAYRLLPHVLYIEGRLGSIKAAKSGMSFLQYALDNGYAGISIAQAIETATLDQLHLLPRDLAETISALSSQLSSYRYIIEDAGDLNQLDDEQKRQFGFGLESYFGAMVDSVKDAKGKLKIYLGDTSSI